MPSYTEGFPYVILEAMAYACPIVATTVGAIPEMLADGCGELIEPQDVNSIRNGITKTLANFEKAISMGIKAQDKVLRCYTIETIYNLYQEVWSGLLV